MVLPEKYDHAIYKHCDEKEADGIAWAFVNKEKMVLFPYKCPPVGPNEIRANILYSGLCHSDVMTVREHWGECIYPMAPGHEIIAEVCEIGAKVRGFKKGELVGFGTLREVCETCSYCKEGRENLCPNVHKNKKYTYNDYWGGYSTLIQQPAAFFFHLPAKFDIKAGAPLFCAGITTFYPIKKFLKKGMITGVAGIGGLGHVAVKFLKSLGHQVVGFTSSKEKTEVIKSVGSVEVVDTKDTKAMMERAGTIDFLVNTLPVNDGFGDFCKVMRNGGILAQVGLPSVEKGGLEIQAFDLVAREITLVGSSVGPRKETNEMIELCVKKDIYPIVEEFAFEDFPKAFEKLEKGQPKFRCVVNCGDYSKKLGLFKK